MHKEQAGDRFAVVGIMINGDAPVENPTFAKLLSKWSAVEKQVADSCNGVVAPTKNRPFVSDSTFNVYDLIPKGSSFYHYDGSLTTPPCSEVVWWEVVDVPLSVSPEQFDRLVRMTTTYTDPNTCELQTAASPLDGSTNRPIAQDLAGREVQRICPVDQIGETAASDSLEVAYANEQPYYSSAEPYVIEVTPETPATPPESAENLLASARQWSRFTADDYDPYEGM